jgi:hypothetical protein
MEYKNQGMISPNKWKKSEKQPDHKGAIKLERQLLKKLMDLTDEDDITIKLSGWDRKGQYGLFISLKYDDFVENKQIPKVEVKPMDDSEIPF